VFRVFPIGFISVSLRYPSEQNVLVKGLYACRTGFTQIASLSAYPSNPSLRLQLLKQGCLVDVLKPDDLQCPFQPKPFYDVMML